jgi:hypothetical protein
VGETIEEVAAVSGPLKKYRVKRGGFETVMKLNAADAERLGATLHQPDDAASTIEPVAAADGAEGDSDAPAVVGPSVAVSDSGGTVSETPPPVQPAADAETEPAKAPAKRRTAANKARSGSANKAADGGS